MAGVLRPGKNNDELVDNQIKAHYIKTPEVERAFRTVDRGNYFFQEYRMNAYEIKAWKHGNIHISAPCIYGMVMENLNLSKGLSFLNIGSGTGYLSTMVGLIIGSSGTNHGVEIYQDVIAYAYRKLEEFNKTVRFGFCKPVFVKGNGLCLASDTLPYDRVYCGASCPENYQNYMKNLIKVGGVLIMPLDGSLLKITRTSQTQWEQKIIAGVAFTTLQLPSETESKISVNLPQKISLQMLRTSVQQPEISFAAPPLRLRIPAGLQNSQTSDPTLDSHVNFSLLSVSSCSSGEKKENEATKADITLETTNQLSTTIKQGQFEKKVENDSGKEKTELLENLKKVIHRLQDFAECPVCYSTLDSTLIQCKNGHGICSCCARKIEKCPSCQTQFVVRQSTLLGQILECIPKLCPYVDAGCTVIVFDNDHGKFCDIRPSVCNNTHCYWSGCVKDLIGHVKTCEKRKVCEISPDTKVPQYFTIDRTQDTSFYVPIIYQNQLFWEYFHRNATTKRISYRFHHVATVKPNCSYYFVVAFKKGKFEHSNTFKAVLDMENDKACESEIGLFLADSELDKFRSTKENGKYEYSIEVITEDIA